MSEPTLLPCPFCGSAKVEVTVDSSGRARWVACLDCSACGPRVHWSIALHGTRAAAIRGWNKGRVEPK